MTTMMIQRWHIIPGVLGFLLFTIPFLICSSSNDETTISSTSTTTCRYPNSIFSQYSYGLKQTDYIFLWIGQIGCWLFALPWSWMGIACILQIFDMDDRLLKELKPYKDDGETVDGWLAEEDEKKANDTQSRFLIRYQIQHAQNLTIRKVIRLTNQRDKERLLSLSSSSSSLPMTTTTTKTGGGGENHTNSIPLVMVLPNECSAVAQSWLEDILQERTSMKRRWIHMGAAMYGIGLYFIIASIFLVEDSRNGILLLGGLCGSIPFVHVYLLRRHDNFVQCYLNPSSSSSSSNGNSISSIAGSHSLPANGVYTAVPFLLAQIA